MPQTEFGPFDLRDWSQSHRTLQDLLPARDWSQLRFRVRGYPEGPLLRAQDLQFRDGNLVTVVVHHQGRALELKPQQCVLPDELFSDQSQASPPCT